MDKLNKKEESIFDYYLINRNLNIGKKLTHVSRHQKGLNNSLQTVLLIEKVSNLDRETEILKKRDNLSRNSKNYYSFFILRGYSSLVENSTADQEVFGSNPSVP